jgi:acylphosphatase
MTHGGMDAGTPIRCRLMVQGRVQGVAFRMSACTEARRLGLGGWVRNTPDGAVEVVAEGPQEAVQAFVAWCRRGPPAAEVTNVAVTYTEASGGFAGFNVRNGAD